MIQKKKLIEVALPLEAINKASAKEKSLRHGHPSTLHLWWARRPLAAARAVIFAQMVDDPSEHTGALLSDPDKKRAATVALGKRLEAWTERKARHEEARRKGDQTVAEAGEKPTLEECVADIERERLFRIIENLVVWENTTKEEFLQPARDEIWRSWRSTCAENSDHPRAKELFDPHKLPAFHDPFAGGGALPLEAQRLGLDSYASDLNPVAVLINKAMIEIPPKFAGKPPVNPEWQTKSAHEKAANQWHGAQGLAEDVRFYGKWMRREAEKRIGHLYPKVEVTEDLAKSRPDLKPYVGQKLTVIAWIWARTVKSPNPAFAQVDVPLASTFVLSTKAGKEAYVNPVIDGSDYRFVVKVGKSKDSEVAKIGTKISRGANFRCLMSGSPIAGDYVKAQGMAGRMSARLMAIVAEGDRGRIYLSPTEEHERIAASARATWAPDQDISYDPHSGATYCVLYGLTRFSDLFTTRQIVALTAFCDLVQGALTQVKVDAIAAGLLDDGKPLDVDGVGATAYADALAMYLALAVGKLSDNASAICSWHNGAEHQKIRATFSRQALPMTWDFAEGNVFSVSTGNFQRQVDLLAEVVDAKLPASRAGRVSSANAAAQSLSANKVVSADPPYYDNVPYADLSDFFYVWLRRSLRPVFPGLFATLAVPKEEELVAFAYRHDSKAGAEAFFLNGMTQAMHCIAEQAHPTFPVTIYYAFKQAESDGADGTARAPISLISQ